jgi:hypothetical protein
VRIQKLASTDAFIAWDLDGDETAVGVVRCAPKILVDGAELLARSTTYAFAAFGLRHSGASAGINAKPDNRDDAITAFMEEVAPLVGGGRLVLTPGNGVTADDLQPLDLGALPHTPDDPSLTAAGVVAAAGAAVDGGLSDKAVAMIGGGPLAEAAKAAAAAAGATVADGSAPPADVLFVAGKAGVLDEDTAQTVKAGVVVPLTPVPVTAKAYAVLSRAGVVYIPDFLALAAPLLAAFDHDSGVDPVARVGEAVQAVAGDGVDAWRTAVANAEGFLSTWQDQLPFGRPLA